MQNPGDDPTWEMDEVSQRFAILFRGGKIAIDDPAEGGFRPWQSDSGGFMPADDKDFIVTCDDHLYRGPSYLGMSRQQPYPYYTHLPCIRYLGTAVSVVFGDIQIHRVAWVDKRRDF